MGVLLPELSWPPLELEGAQGSAHRGQLLGTPWGRWVKGTAGGFRLPGKESTTWPVGRLKQVQGRIHPRGKAGTQGKVLSGCAAGSMEQTPDAAWFHWRARDRPGPKPQSETGFLPQISPVPEPRLNLDCHPSLTSDPSYYTEPQFSWWPRAP